jgi:predicted dehydrogenase
MISPARSKAPAQPRVYRLGVLGLGHRARSLIRAARLTGRFDVTAIGDAWEGEAGPVGRAADEAPEASYVRSWRALLAEDIDAVVIAVPNDRHRELVVSALEAGRHVVCEKPVAPTLEEMRAVLAAAARSTAVLHIGMELRYAPMTRALLTDLDSGALPEPRLVWAQEFRPPFRPGARGWRLDRRRTGGTLVEKNCHHFDLFCVLLADRPVAVTASGTGAPSGMLEHAAVTVEFAGGALASCAVAMTQPTERLRVGALGPGWTYDYDSRHHVSTVERGDVVVEQRWKVDTRGPEDGGWDHPGEVEQFDAFAARLDGEADATMDRAAPQWGHLIAFAAERAVRERRVVEITDEGELR